VPLTGKFPPDRVVYYYATGCGEVAASAASLVQAQAVGIFA